MSKVKAPTASLALLRRVRGLAANGLDAAGPAVAGLATAVALLCGSSLSAQASEPASLRDSWSVTVTGGVLNYELSDNEAFPAFSLRADTPISDYARVEVEAWYSRPDVQQDENFLYDPSLPVESANLFSFIVGIQLRYTLGSLEPYAGASGGVFARYDYDSEGQRFSRNTFSFPLGVRVWVTDNLGIRGEYRFRQDNHEAFTYSSTEITGGVFWTF
jgi:opacity protein-like surface antigen